MDNKACICTKLIDIKVILGSVEFPNKVILRVCDAITDLSRVSTLLCSYSVK